MCIGTSWGELFIIFYVVEYQYDTHLWGNVFVKLIYGANYLQQSMYLKLDLCGTDLWGKLFTAVYVVETESVTKIYGVNCLQQSMYLKLGLP